MRRQSHGFSLMEVLLVIAIMMIITAIGAPLYTSLTSRNELDVAANVLIQDLYRAQSASRNVTDDKAWGVAVSGQTITLYRGATYAGRDSGLDETYNVPDSVKLSGTTDLAYQKLSGQPGASASFTLTGSNNSRTITVNAKGMVDY